MCRDTLQGAPSSRRRVKGPAHGGTGSGYAASVSRSLSPASSSDGATSTAQLERALETVASMLFERTGYHSMYIPPEVGSKPAPVRSSPVKRSITTTEPSRCGPPHVPADVHEDTAVLFSVLCERGVRV